MTIVVNCRDSRYDVYIGRPSKWGNPFRMDKNNTRDDVVKDYQKYILKRPQLLKCLHELRGKILGCWCSPARCHGDVLVELCNKIDSETTT